MNRRSLYSRLFKVMETPAGPVVISIVDDLPDEVLQWHYDNAMENEDYEYAQAVSVEAEGRRIRIKT